MIYCLLFRLKLAQKFIDFNSISEKYMSLISQPPYSLHSLSFDDIDKERIRNLQCTQIICQNFIIENNQFFIFYETLNIIIIHPIICSFDKHCFSYCSNLTLIIFPIL
jgi:hypothetical protein